MKLSDYDLQQLDEKVINSLQPDAVKNLASQLLHDLKISREKLNQNSQNSSMPPSSEAPWDKASAHNSDDEIDNDLETDAASTEEDALKAALQFDDDTSSDTVSDENELTAVADPSQEKTVSEPPRKAGKQPGAQGFGRTQKITVHHQQSHYPTQCACCGQSFDSTSHFIAYTAFDSLNIDWGNLEQPGIKVVNTRHTYYKKECACGHVTRDAPVRLPPDSELPGIELGEWRLVGANLACLIVCLSKRMRLSRARIREFLDDWLGLTLSVGTINNTIHEAGRAALPVEDMLVEEVIKSEVLHIDETSWKQKKEPFLVVGICLNNGCFVQNIKTYQLCLSRTYH